MRLKEYKTMVEDAMSVYKLACKATILNIIRKRFKDSNIDFSVNDCSYYLKTLSVKQLENEEAIPNEELKQYDENVKMLETIAYQTADDIYNHFSYNDINIKIERSVYINGEIQFEINCDNFRFDIYITNRYFKEA